MPSARLEAGRPGRHWRSPLLLGLALLLLNPARSLADAWPEAPPILRVEAEALRGEAARDYRYAAGLYRALARELGDGNTALLAPVDAERLGRALLSLGQGEAAAAQLAGREDLSPGLALLLALQREPESWSDLDHARWRQAFPGEDGDSSYWRARLAQAEGRPEQARTLLNELLRREQGSIFAPAALELLQSLPEPEALSSARTGSPAAGGLRVQWGVFRDARGARRLREAVAAYGQDAEVLRFRQDGHELYRVCSPPCVQEAEARALGESLRLRFGLDYVLHRSEESGASP